MSIYLFLNFVINGASTALQQMCYAVGVDLAVKKKSTGEEIVWLNVGTGVCGVIVTLVRIICIYTF